MSVKTEQGRKLPAVPIVSAFSSVITFLLVPHDCVNVNQMDSVRVLRDGGVCSQRGLRGWLGVVDCRQRWCFFRAKHQRATSWLRRGRCRTGTTRTDTPPETRWRLTGGKAPRRAAGHTRRTHTPHAHAALLIPSVSWGEQVKPGKRPPSCSFTCSPQSSLWSSSFGVWSSSTCGNVKETVRNLRFWRFVTALLGSCVQPRASIWSGRGDLTSCSSSLRV